MGFKILKSPEWKKSDIAYKHGNVFHCKSKSGNEGLFMLIKAHGLAEGGNHDPWHLATIKGLSEWYGMIDRFNLDWKEMFLSESDVTMYDSI